VNGGALDVPRFELVRIKPDAVHGESFRGVVKVASFLFNLSLPIATAKSYLLMHTAVVGFLYSALHT
jgi:hypothetical protein